MENTRLPLLHFGERQGVLPSSLDRLSETNMSGLPSTETLQLVVLHALEAHGAISDSRQLRLALPTGVETNEAVPLASLEQAGGNAPVVGPTVDAQNALKSALDSLATREVSFSPRTHFYWQLSLRSVIQVH